MIKVKNISKSFRVSVRQAGFGRAVKALFSREYSIDVYKRQAYKTANITIKMENPINPNMG